MTDIEKEAFFNWITAQRKAGMIYASEADTMEAWRAVTPTPTGYHRANPWDVGVTIHKPV
jgi:hypothetical protein